MTTAPTESRRRFLERTAIASSTLTATSWSSLARGDSASQRIRVGVIGTGVRGKYLIGNLPDSATPTAICDCAAANIADTINPSGQFKQVLQKFSSEDAVRCSKDHDYRRLIDRKDLDAVIIATPDHHHASVAMLALEAGLDVYLEKPLTVTIREGRLLADMVKKTGRILQVGSQQRTMEVNRYACEFIRDGGLGKIAKVDFPNYPGPISNPSFPGEPIPQGLDWNLFLGPTPYRNHNRHLWIKDKFKVGQLTWRGWDLFRDYSGHLMTNWGAHSIDMVQYALGMDNSGPTRISPATAVPDSAIEDDWRAKWHKKTPRPEGSWRQASRFHPVAIEYANGVKLNLLPGIGAATFYGEQGRMVISRNKFMTNPTDLIKDGPDLNAAQIWKGDGHVARPHLQNWLDCIGSRAEPNAPAEIGHRTVTVCHLVNIVRELGRPVTWDPEAERFVNDDQANSLLDRPRRDGFDLPSA